MSEHDQPAVDSEADALGRERRLVLDPPAVLAQVAHQAGVDIARATWWVRAIRHAVDYVLADNDSVLVYPFMAHTPGDAVVTAFETRLDSLGPDDEVPADVVDALHSGEDDDTLIAWLGIPPADYYAHLPTGRGPLLAEALTVAGYPDDEDVPMHVVEQLNDVLNAWTDTFADGRRYRMCTAGRELHLGRWLLDHPARLAAHGFPVEVLHQQLVLADRCRPDLIARFTTSTDFESVGDLLVIELKATRC